MNTPDWLDPKSWAERTIGSVQRHDRRRTRRAGQAATRLAENPLGSRPAHMRTWKETKALDRLLDEPEGNVAALRPPHLQQTREQANASPVVLLVQDTTDLDLSHRQKISGVGHIGNERGRGCVVQTVLAVRPETREMLGCMAQEPFVRIPAPEGEQRYQRRKRDERETAVWMRQVHAMGTPEPGSKWLHLGDRGADMFPFFQACHTRVAPHSLVQSGLFPIPSRDSHAPTSHCTECMDRVRHVTRRYECFTPTHIPSHRIPVSTMRFSQPMVPVT